MSPTIQQDKQALTDRLFPDLASYGAARIAIIPGDPDRVDVVSSFMTDVHSFDFARGYRGATGLYGGSRIFVLSSGIGGAGFERSLVELQALGVDTIIRVGTTGALREGIEPGDLIINEGSVRLDGTSTLYVRSEYPAAAAWEVVHSLVEEAVGAPVRYFTGIGATTASFFAGQGRSTFSGFEPYAPILEEMRHAGVTNFEMEGATLFTLARLFGIRAGAICVVVNNRLNGALGGKQSIPVACEIALKAAARLAAIAPAEVRA